MFAYLANPFGEAGHNTPPDCPGNGNSNRLVSLWDIVNQFDLLPLGLHVQIISQIAREFSLTATSYQAHDLAPELRERLQASLRDLQKFCETYHFRRSVRKIERTLDRFAWPELLSRSWLANELENVLEFLWGDVQSRSYLIVRAEVAGFIDERAPFGEAVRRAFPSAAADLTQAGNCLAAECDTAAVFHLMRAVEWALRALCIDLGLRSVRRKERKTGRVTYLPLGWSDWETLLNQLKNRVHDALAKTKRGSRKQLFQEFYLPALQDIEAMKDAWRNHVMHARREYTREDALAVLSHVRRLMVKLSDRIAE